MIDAWRAATYEALELLGPVWSALAAGFAVIWFGELVITSAGERYLERLRP